MSYDVTIGIPVYRVEDYIRRTMESALSQTYPSIEFLIVNDATDDASIDIVRELQQTHARGRDIRILEHTVNQGVSVSRNEIIAEAHGTYLYFMDSDDIIGEDTIELLMSAVKAYQADIAFGSYEKIEVNGERSVYQYPDTHFTKTDELANFAYRRYAGIQASSCNFLVNLNLLRNTGLRFNKSDFWEDTIFTLELVTYVHRAVLLSAITYSYLCRAHSLSDIQEKSLVNKSSVEQYLKTVEQLKRRKGQLKEKAYYPNRCYVAVMSDFYIICNILKRGDNVTPRFSDKELRDYLAHPAILKEITTFRQRLTQNVLLYLLGKLPAPLCISIIRVAGKLKGLI